VTLITIPVTANTVACDNLAMRSGLQDAAVLDQSAPSLTSDFINGPQAAAEGGSAIVGRSCYRGWS